MCGIIGYIGKRNAVSVVLEGLKRLEYRGYDSAGIAFFSDKGVEIRKCTGKIKDLYAIIDSDKPFSATAKTAITEAQKFIKEGKAYLRKIRS
jgi:glucosamine 6-phosphate synthetase-like amidotransferase/phosphosugar isomerase protein